MMASNSLKASESSCVSAVALISTVSIYRVTCESETNVYKFTFCNIIFALWGRTVEWMILKVCTEKNKQIYNISVNQEN